MKRHVNIPIFIPHYGCPNDCVFCNQRKITGKPSYSKDSVINEIDTAISTVDTANSSVELAFFGGSFTAIPRSEMLGLLEISDKYIESGIISGVRLSTRPDAISDEILDILTAHGVKTIELGLQSFSDKVLAAAKRGHTALDSEKACKLIKKRGFTLIGQMMVGLPLSTVEDEINTAQTICDLGCDGARVYPTVVFPDTRLMEMTRSGEYTPLTTEEAVERTAEVLSVFADSGVKVIRIGLCSNETLRDPVYEGSYHPSVGELSLNRFYLKKMTKMLKEITDISGKTVTFSVSKGKISQAVGQKRYNVLRIKEAFDLKDVRIKENDDLREFDLSADIS